MSFFISTSASVSAGSKIVTFTGSPDINNVRRSDALFIGGTGPYEVDFTAIAVGGERTIHLETVVPTAFTDVRCVVVPTAGDFIAATAKIREVSEFGVNVFSSLARWATDEVASVDITDAAGVVHTVPTIWFLTSSAGNLIDQNTQLKETVDYLQPLVAQLQTDFNNVQPAVAATLSSAQSLKTAADNALPTITSAVDTAQNARDATSAMFNTVTLRHGEVGSWYTLIAGYEATYTSKRDEAVNAATLAGTHAASALTHRNAAEGFKNNAATSASNANTSASQANTAATTASGHAGDALTHRNQAETFRNGASTSATNAATSATLAQRWASDPEGTVVDLGLYSARHYAAQAYTYAQQTAANVSGGISFRGFHNPSSGFPVGADTGYQYKLSAAGTLTFEVDGTKAVSAGDYIIKTANGWVHLDDASDAVKTSRTINGFPLSANVVLTAANVGARADTWVPTFAQVTSKPTTLTGYGITDAVPIARTINGQALSANVVLTAANVGARADSWVPTFAQITSKPTNLSGYGITDAVALAGDQTIAGNKTFSGNVAVGTLISSNAVVARAFGTEGGQVVLGYASSGAIAGQANNTWNIDVDTSNSLRFFRFDNSGNALIALTMDQATGLVTSNFRFRIGANMTNAAAFNIASQGTADPTTLVDGDIWHRSNALYARLGGGTRQLIHTGNPTTLASDISQAEIEAGTATTRRWVTAQRVAQAIAAQAAPKSATALKLEELEGLAILGL
jgi:hypothetical protein